MVERRMKRGVSCNKWGRSEQKGERRKSRINGCSRKVIVLSRHGQQMKWLQQLALHTGKTTQHVTETQNTRTTYDHRDKKDVSIEHVINCM